MTTKSKAVPARILVALLVIIGACILIWPPSDDILRGIGFLGAVLVVLALLMGVTQSRGGGERGRKER